MMKLQPFGLQLYLKRDSATGVSHELCEICKNILFTEHLWANASVYHIYIFFSLLFSSPLFLRRPYKILVSAFIFSQFSSSNLVQTEQDVRDVVKTY